MALLVLGLWSWQPSGLFIFREVWIYRWGYLALVGADSVLFCLGYCYGCWTKDDMDGAPTLGLLATLLQRLLIGLCACYDKVPWSRLVVSFPPPQTCYPIPPCPFYCQVANCNPCNNKDCKTIEEQRQQQQCQTKDAGADAHDQAKIHVQAQTTNAKWHHERRPGAGPD